jgi:hypothetical protein
MKLIISLGTIILLVVACQTTQKVETAGSSPAWNSSMKEFKHNLMILQPYIFNSALFNDPDNYQFLSQKIHQLSEQSTQVTHETRMRNDDPTIQFVAVHFAEELSQADINFKEGAQDYSRSQLMKVTSYCLECHTRLRQGPSFMNTDSDEPFIKTLHIADRIELMISFRQFDAAFNLALESLSMPQEDENKNYKADRIARLGLSVAVQYLGSREKTEKIINTIASNPTLPIYLKQNNRYWKISVKKWTLKENLNSLPRIRVLVNSRTSEIDDMRAIRSLLSLLTRDLNPNDLGEALLLTGQSYEELRKVSTMSLHENYYEMCVRKAAATKWAKPCMARYSDSIVMSFSGSSGTHIPKDVDHHLEELRKIIKDAQP